MIRRDHDIGHAWNHNKPHNQDGIINSLIIKEKTVDDVINEFKRSFPGYEGNHRSRVLGHIRHLIREHEDFPYDIVDDKIISKEGCIKQ